MQTIVEMIFGSHLYGTDTPESDTDYKSVYMPSIHDIILNKIKRNITTSSGAKDSKNSSEDVDIEVFSLHEFFRLLCEGQTVAIDMIHSPVSIKDSWVWRQVRKDRAKFYTKDSKAFLGYAQRQAAKYGVKGSRLKSAKNFYVFINEKDDNDRLCDFWDELPRDEHCKDIANDPNGHRQIQAVGKVFGERVPIKHILGPMNAYITEYGARAQMAERNEGIDWKAISHALRAGYQLKSMVTQGDIIFPLPNAKHIREVKEGSFDYKAVSVELENLIDEVKQLLEASELPNSIDMGFADDYLFGLIRDYYQLNIYDNATIKALHGSEGPV